MAWQPRGAPDLTPQQLGNQQTTYQNYPGVANMNPNMQQQQQQYWPGQGGPQPQYGYQSSEPGGNNANQYYSQYNQNYSNQGYSNNPNAVNYQHNYYQNSPQQQQQQQQHQQTYRKQQDGWEDNWDWGWDENKHAQFVAQQAMSTASQVPPTACNNANVIEESFNTTDTWNWSLEDKPEGNKQSTVKPGDVSNSENSNHRRESVHVPSSLAPLSEESNVRTLHDRDAVKEHLPNLALGKRFHLDNLTPQWSIESQVSQESSDGLHTHSESTYRSDNQSRNSSKSSPGLNTEGSNFNYSQSVLEEASSQNTEWSRHSTEDSTTLDNISQSVAQQPDTINEQLLPHMHDLHISNQENLNSNINEQLQEGRENDTVHNSAQPSSHKNNPPFSSTLISQTSSIISQSPVNLPVPQHYPVTSSPTNVPPPTTFPSMPAQNPFKSPSPFSNKTSAKSSTTIPKEAQSHIPSGALSSPAAVNKISQLHDKSVLGYPTANLETTPDNSEQPDQPQTSTYRSMSLAQQLPDNLEVAPRSDRNEYLQTAHLSNSEYVDNTDFSRHVPPPGLRRMVVGQQEPEFNQTLTLSTDEPPPGLARMVPGQQTENDNSFSQSGENFMDRLIDGQPTQDTQRNPFRQADGQQTPDLYAQSSARTDRRPIGLDRMVPGESSNDDYNRSQQYQTVGYASNEQRVVTGLDHNYGTSSVDIGNTDVREQNMDGSDYSSSTTRPHRGGSDTTSVPVPTQPDLDQQREVIMEGENLQDLSVVSSAELSFSREHIVGGSDMNPMDASTVKTDISDSLEMHSNNSRRHSINRVNTSGEESERDRAFKSSPRRDMRKLSGEQDRDKDRYVRDERRYDKDSDRKRGDKRVDKEGRRGERSRRSKEQSPEDRRARRSARSRRYDTEDTDYYSDREKERRRYREGSYTTSKPPRPDDKDRRYRDDRDRSKRYATIERERRYELDERDGASRSRRGERDRDDDRYERRYRDIDPASKYGHVRRERREDERRRGTDRDSGESGGGDEQGGERGDRDERRRARAARGGRPREHYYDAYVQQYQYYEHLRRHDPAAYTHLYHTLMSGRSAAADPLRPVPVYPDGGGGGTASVHSGRSSGNNFTINTEFNTDGSLNLHLEESTVRSERMTPFKYSTAHVKGAVSSPHMVLVQPSYPADGRPAAVQVLDVGALLSHDRHARALRRYPGPLLVGLTHKPTVVDYCRERSQQAARAAPHDPAGYALIWDLLALLLRQNGVAMGSDLAELLLNNQRQYDLKPTGGGDRRADSRSGSALSSRSRSPDTHQNPHPHVDTSPTSAVSEQAALDKYREYLEMGNVQQALEWAVGNCLWAHALQLAAWCGPRARVHVAARFLAALSPTDTLHTLYSQRAARAPPAVTAVLSDKWADWRPHLAIMLANPSSKPDLDRKSIVQMGDSLQARGLPLSAQFCYVSGDLEFAPHPLAPLSSPTQHAAAPTPPRLSLLLAPPAPARLSQLAHDEALFATSIYEYARSLHVPFVLESFQEYKLVLAARLVDAGLPERALLCTELLARELSARPARYPRALLRLTADLADRLRHYEPALPAALPGEVADDADSAHSSPTRHLRWIDDIQAAAHIRTSDHPQQQLDYSSSLPAPPAPHPEPPPHSPSPGPLSTPQYQPQPPEPERQPESLMYSWSPEQSPQQYLQPVPVVSSVPVAPVVPVEEERHYWQEEAASYYGEESSAAVQPATISMPGAPSAARPALFDDYDDEPRAQTQHNEKSPGGHGPHADEGDKKGEEGRGRGTGWFGGIFNKLSLRPPNQMILPDDKNPSIVWDADNKRWRNLDCDDEETSGPPPPPPALQQHFDATSPLAPPGAPGAPGAPVSNIFKMQKSRHIKRSYVDVFNQTAATARAPPASEVLPPAPPPLSAGHAYIVPQQSSETEEMVPSSM